MRIIVSRSLGWLVALMLTMSSALAAVPGKTVYEGTCIACHGAGGEGTLPGVPDFTDPMGVLRKSDGELIDHMINVFQSPGSPLAMPPKGGDPSLTREDIEQVLRYLRETFGGR